MSRLALKAIQAAAGGGAGEAVYVDDLFSTYLYQGDGASSKTITNGIDLSGEGGLVWFKNRVQADAHVLCDTERGVLQRLTSNTANVSANDSGTLSSFTSTGFTIGNDPKINTSGEDICSWTFRKQQGFFDIVTYTGDGSGSTAISHGLGSVPGMIIVKRTSASGDWAVYHRGVASNPANYKLKLNGSNARFYSTSYFPTVPTSSVFYPGSDSDVNGSGETYIAYLFAHDAQDFGENSNEAIIKCGSYSNSGSAWSVDLGFEPQFLLRKLRDGTSAWQMTDTMRGLFVDGNARQLKADVSNAENNSGGININATGFNGDGTGDTGTWVYMAIRRPHKPAEEFSATELFDVFKYTDNTLNQSTNPILLTADGQTSGPSVLTDMWWHRLRSTGISDSFFITPRLIRFGTGGLVTQSTGAEPQGDAGELKGFDQMTGVEVGPNGTFYYSSSGAGNRTHISYYLRRAPGFFDVVAYTGQSAEMSVSHNLGVTPELIIQKCRTQGSGYNWNSWYTGLTNSQYINLNTTAAPASSSNLWGTNSTVATDSVFRVGSATTGVNGGSSNTHIAYLFATAEGISKVGTYTGSGSTQTINCGFSNGARFVLIKCISGSSNWFVWDSERGITSGLDPYIIVNQTAAETTNSPVDVNPASSGFEVFGNDSDSNRNNETYLFLAIA